MIYLTRHGETEWNRERRVQGWRDSPLTPRGEAQARAMGRTLKARLGGDPHLQIVVSPLGRTQTTAHLILAEMGLDRSRISFDARLREIGYGEIEGLTWTEFKARDSDLFAAFTADPWNVRLPGGESCAMVGERVGAWLAERTADRTTLVISHGIAGRILRGVYLGLGYAAMAKLSIGHEELHVLANGSAETVNVGEEV